MIREFDLSGRMAVVTGGAAGIGCAICETLAEAGATVVVADRDEAAARALAAALNGQALALDVTDADMAETVAAGLAAEFGAPDILVNNAGIVQNAPRWKWIWPTGGVSST